MTVSTPLDTVVHRGDGTIIGAFRVAPDHRSFVDSGPIQNDIFVFPRTSVRIRHAGGPRFVADQTVATVYNRGQIYDRTALSEDGDRSDWFAIPRSVAIQAVIANRLEPVANGPFPFATAPVSEETYFAQRRIFHKARRKAVADSIDEDIYALLDDVVSAAARVKVKAPRSDPSSLEIAAEIRSLLSAHPGEDWPLSRLQDRLGLSAFQLCRAFRKASGGTIHRYLVSLRLRSSLERLERPHVDISAVALDLGFSGHSHFSQAFARGFDLTPSACRRLLSTG